MRISDWSSDVCSSDLVDGCIVPATAMRDISARLSSQPVSERAARACIGLERADLVVAGCAILEDILDACPANELQVAARTIREGRMREMMQSYGHKLRRRAIAINGAYVRRPRRTPPTKH